MDAIYRYILRKLQENGRITPTEIGNIVGITTNAAKNRMDNLVNKYIKKIVAIPENKMWGYYIDGYCMIMLNEQTQNAFDSFISHVDTIEEVRNVDLVTGSVDFILRIVAKDQYHLHDILENIRSSPYLQKYQFFNILENRIDKTGIPI